MVIVCNCTCCIHLWATVGICCQLTAGLYILGCLCHFFSHTRLVIFDKVKQSCNILFQILDQDSTRGRFGSSGKLVDMVPLQICQAVADFVQFDTIMFGYVHIYILFYIVVPSGKTNSACQAPSIASAICSSSSFVKVLRFTF